MNNGLIETPPLTKEAIEKWLLYTTRHCCLVEYNSRELKIKTDDPQRPHDIEGTCSKFDWNVLRILALQYAFPKGDIEYYRKIVYPKIHLGVLLHRTQYHHEKWNEHNDSATRDDMRFGALDTIYTILDDRPYHIQRTLEELDRDAESIIVGNAEEKIPWIRMIIKELRQVPQPDISVIKSIYSIEDISLGPVHSRICQLRDEALEMLRGKGYEF